MLLNDDESIPLPSPKATNWFFKSIKPLTDLLVKIKLRRRAKNKDQEVPLEKTYQFLGNRPFWGYHALFIVLVLTIGASSTIAKASIEHDILTESNIYPIESKAQLAASVGEYTEVINEDPTGMILAEAIEDTSGYYSEPLLTETKTTDRPEPVEDLTNRSESISYTVQDGDTLSKIGLRYGLKVASIQYQNDLTGETITPGQTLILPPGDISSDLIAKANNDTSQTSTTSYATTTVDDSSYSSTGFVRPMAGTITRRITSDHTGTDISAAPGTPVVAAAAGQVTQVAYGWNGGYGTIITIDHGGGVKTRYAHLSSTGVSVGQYVGAGQYIGGCGNTGRVYGASGGYHLHFEAIVGGRFTAPF